MSDIKDSRGQMLSDDAQKADLLNDFFASVFVNEPTGQLPVFYIKYHGLPVSRIKKGLIYAKETVEEYEYMNLCKLRFYLTCNDP